MPLPTPQPAAKREKKLPLSVVLVLLYQLAKVGFFGWVFVQCLQAQGTGIPPFGEVEAHNPLFESPLLFLFAFLAVYHLALALGLLLLARWARAGSVLPLAAAVLWAVVGRLGLYRLPPIPVESSTILSAFVLEAVVVAILYLPAEVREAFASD